MENRICYIFGAGERSGCEISLSPEDFVIAADGGFDYLNDLGECCVFSDSRRLTGQETGLV